MRTYTDIKDIDVEQWENLVKTSPTASWFQTKEAYDFYASLPDVFDPFVVAVEDGNELLALCVGYVTVEKNPFKQFFSRRAIILAGPLLCVDVTENAVIQLLTQLKSLLRSKAIYIEFRNFYDYFLWKEAFQRVGFDYVPWLNFQIQTNSVEQVDANLSKSRKRDIRTSFRDGAVIVESPTLPQVREWYDVLVQLYKTKVKTPLFPFVFFEKLYALPSAHFLLVEVDGKIVGGTCAVGRVGRLYEWFVCGKDHDFRNIYPSTLATYAGLSQAAKNDFSVFDMMGAGSPGAAYGVRDFKAKFGGDLVEHGRFIHILKPVLFGIGKKTVDLMKGGLGKLLIDNKIVGVMSYVIMV